MLLGNMVAALFELMREGSIVDDERFDPRLMEDFIITKRLRYLEDKVSKRDYISDNNMQKLQVPLKYREADGLLDSVNDIPNVLSSKNGLVIHEVAAPSHYGAYPFQFVDIDRFRSSGNGKYTQDIVYVTKHFNSIIVKSGNSGFVMLKSLILDAVFEDPREVEGFDKTVDDFPVDLQGFEYIKNEVIRTDISRFINGFSDENNDADGAIDEGTKARRG